MSRHFPLAGLLRARELAEERAAAELARANHTLGLADGAASAARSDLGRLDLNRDRGDAATAAVESPHAWAAVVAARAAAVARLRDAESVLAIARDRAAGAAGCWTDARRDAAMIDKLRVRHARDEAAEELRVEQIAIDESASRRATEEER